MKQATPTSMTSLLKATYLTQWKGKSCADQFYSNVEKAITFLGEGMEITTHEIAMYRRELQNQGLKASTVNQKLVNLHTVLKYGHDNRWIRELPAFKFDRIDDGRTRVLTVSEEAAMLGWFRANGHMNMAAFAELLILTGCRRSELLLAKKKQIEGNWLRLWVTKSGKARSIPLTPRAKELADLFIPFEGLSEYMIDKLWKQAKEASGLGDDESLVLHSLRHTTATRLLKKSGNIAVVKKLLGHASFKTTERYAKLDDDDLMGAVMM